MGEQASAALKKALADAFLSSSDPLTAPNHTTDPNQKVNDLSKMVKKKKKTETQTNGNEAGGSGSGSVADGKRKAEENNGEGNENKKPKVEDSAE